MIGSGDETDNLIQTQNVGFVTTRNARRRSEPPSQA